MTICKVDAVHGRPDGTASRNFRENKKRFILDTDYFEINQPDEIRRLGLERPQGGTPEKVILLTEQGYLMVVKSLKDDLAWEVQRQLVSSYFRVRVLASDLSPQMKMLYGMLDQMAQAEREAKEAKQIAGCAKEVAQKAIDATENIKDAVKPVFDNWREEINGKFNRIQKNCGAEFNMLRSQMYAELESRAGCDLGARIRNRKQRMAESGSTKTDVNRVNRMDIIEGDKKLREIFSKIVSEYEIKYCA